MKLIVVGAGGITRDLLRGLSEIWDVTVVDSDSDRLAVAAEVREVETVLGDGSSRVVLEKAGLTSADALVAATNDDAVNLEASKLALQSNLLRVVSVAADPERLPDYLELDVQALSPDRLTARRIEIGLEPRRVTSAPFAAGMAEAIEFRVAEDATVRGRRLSDLHSESWLIAAVLRDGNLIIPHGDTVLETGDLVTVVGATADYPGIVRVFTAGEATFPTEFGKQVAVPLETESDLYGPVSEAIAMTRSSAAEALLIVHSEPRSDEEQAELDLLIDTTGDMAEGIELLNRSVAGSPMRVFAESGAREGVGLLVTRSPRSGGLLGRYRVARLIRRLAATGLPALVSRGSHPYERVVVPARDDAPGRAAARAGIDLTAYIQSSLLAIAVIPPAFVTGSAAKDEAERAVGLIREEAAVQGARVQQQLREGNPVREILASLNEHDLLILGLGDASPTFLTPGTTGHLLARAPVSVLLVPGAS
ncbi:MAG: NAD-binding protein [Acidimicrobiia bacterium]